MSKFIFQYTLKNMKIKKRNTLFLLLFSIIMVMTLCMGEILNQSLYQVNRLDNEEKYGNWYILLPIIQKEDYQKLYQERKNSFYDEFKPSFIGVVDVKDDDVIGTIDKNFYELSGYKIIKGKKDIQDNEVIVTREYLKKYQLKEEINQKITYNNKQYIIKGIVSSYQSEKYFPDIIMNNQKVKYYTLLANGDIVNFFISDDMSQYISLFDDYSIIYNEYGYDLSIVGKMNEVYDLTLIQIEIFIILSIITFGFIQMMLNKQSKELALLRGIGATKKQLTIMSCFQILLINMVTLPIGLMLSILLSYFLLNMYSLFGHHMVYILSTENLLICLFISFITYTLCFIIPHRSAYKKALSGAFDEDKFKVLGVRRSSLKRQNLFHIASENMVAHGKLNVFIIIISTMIIIVGFFYLYYPSSLERYQQYLPVLKQFNHISILDCKYVDDYRSVISSKTPILEIQSISKHINVYSQQYPKNYNECRISQFVHNDVMTQDRIIGKFPTKDNEVFITKSHLALSEQKIKKDEDGEEIEYFNEKYLTIGDSITISGHQFKIVGYQKYIKLNEDIDDTYRNNDFNESAAYGYLSDINDIYVSSHMFKELSKNNETTTDLYMYISNDDDKDEIYQKFEETKDDTTYLENQYDKSSTSNNNYAYLKQLINKIENDNQKAKQNLIILNVILIGLLILLSIFESQKERKNYYLLRLVGMTQKELIYMQFYRALITVFVGMLINMFIITAYFVDYAYMNISPFIMGTWYLIVVLMFTFIHASSIYFFSNRNVDIFEFNKE